MSLETLAWYSHLYEMEGCRNLVAHSPDLLGKGIFTFGYIWACLFPGSDNDSKLSELRCATCLHSSSVVTFGSYLSETREGGMKGEAQMFWQQLFLNRCKQFMWLELWVGKTDAVAKILFVEPRFKPFGFILRFSDHVNCFENCGRAQPLQVFDLFLKK